MSAKEFEEAYKIVTVGSVAMRVFRHSQGRTPLLLIPDLNYPLEFYEPFAKAATQFTVYSADLAGQGESGPLEEYSLDLFVLQFQEVMKYFNLSEPHVLGHGLGCSIAVRLARQVNVKSMSLVAPPLFPVQYIQRYNGSLLSSLFGKLLPCGRTQAGDSLVREYDERVFDNFPTQFRPLRQAFVRQMSPKFVERNAAIRSWVAGQDVIQEAVQTGYHMRVMLVCGDAWYDYSSAGAFLYHKLSLQASAREDGTHELLTLQPQSVLEWLLDVQGEA